MGTFAFLLSASYLLAGVSAVPRPHAQSKSCDTPEEGYQCFSNVSHMWGQYSPYYSLDKELARSNEVPDGCEVTFVQVLSRHGARYPTEKKSTKYKKLVTAIQANATEFKGKYKFLQTYEYTLGSDDLTAFGEQQMVNSGIGFYKKYKSLARKAIPFVRASGSDRVILSGERFIEGFQETKQKDSKAQKQDAPVVSVIIPEGETFNNTLDHGICTNFEEDESGDEIVDSFVALYAPSIIARLEKDLPGVKLADDDLVSLMDMCPFDTVARTADGSELSPFCNLFTAKEWENYNYKLSLDKYYGYGAGHPLGPEQGIGFANELIARMTQTPVQDHTSVNTTLDSNPATFPLNYTMYADFSHDNTMVSIYFALGLYEKTEPLSKTSVQTIKQTNGFSSAWVAPFGARSYFEKMQCKGEKQPLVRALVNDRVVPLNGCGADKYGRCKLDAFVESLSFARSGGNWDQCFA